MTTTNTTLSKRARTLADRTIRFVVRSIDRERGTSEPAQPPPAPAPAPAPEPAPIAASTRATTATTSGPTKHPEARPPTVDPSATHWSRSDVFGDKWTWRPLTEFTGPADPVSWTEDMHRDQVTLAPGNVQHLAELRPDRHALIELLLQAGYDDVWLVPAPETSASRFFKTGEKTLLLATCSQQ